MLFIGIGFIAVAFLKRNRLVTKGVFLVGGVGLAALSIFMFQPGSAEIVASLFNI